MRRVHLELQITAGQVIRTQGFNVGVELGPRVAVGLGVPAQPAPGVEIKEATQGRFRKDPVADNSYLTDFCRTALDHRKGQIDPIALNRRDRGHHFGCVQTTIDVLALEFLLGPVKLGLVKRTAIGQTDIAQSLLENFLVKLFSSHKINVGNGRPLLNQNHQHIAAHFNPNVLEQAQAKQCPNRGGTFFVIVDIADPNRQGDENRARLHPLQAFNPDIAHGKRVYGPRRIDHKQQGRHGGYGA